MNGDDLVFSNAVGDVLFGDTNSDVYIGDGVNSVDLLFEQSGSIKGEDGSSVTLTVGSSGTTLNLYDPQMANGATITSTLTVGTGGSIDFTPDSGAFLKFDGQTILERRTQNGAITFGHDDTIIIAGGDTSSTLNTNYTASSERVVIGAESGLVVHAFPSNNTAWSNRKTWEFRDDGSFYVGSTEVIDTNGAWVGSNSGLKGEPGTNGTNGSKGQKGAAGSNGSNGTNGSKGQKGEAGTNGTNGSKGQKGQAGTNGSNGSDGSKGQKGGRSKRCCWCQWI